MGYPFEGSPQLEGEDFFHFTGYKHALDTDYMKFSWRDHLFLVVEVSIHQKYTVEVALVGELVGSRYFDHPVQHASSELGVDLMSTEEGRRSIVVLLLFKQIAPIVLEIGSGNIRGRGAFTCGV